MKTFLILVPYFPTVDHEGKDPKQLPKLANELPKLTLRGCCGCGGGEECRGWFEAVQEENHAMPSP